MLVEAKTLEDGTVVNKYETHLECAHCGMEVDAEEYASGTCSDCGEPWNEKRHVAIHVTSIPLSGETS